MSGSSEKIIALRHLIAERFAVAPPHRSGLLPTEISAIDRSTGGGLPGGAITEIVSARPSSGGQLLILKLLEITRRHRRRAVLIDGHDAFDPGSHEPDLLPHLLWARCHSLAEAQQAADIIVHDANFGLIILDLRGFGWRDLRTIAPTVWYRFQRAIEASDTVLLVLTSTALVSSAVLRFTLSGCLTLESLDEPQLDLAAQLPLELERNRLQAERRTA